MYKIGIAGAGAMGGRIGVSIKEAGYDVTLIYTISACASLASASGEGAM